MVKCMLLDNDIPIRSCWSEDRQDGATLGTTYRGEKVVRIDVHRVAGQGGYVPWFAIHGPDGVLGVFNAAHIAEVEYDVLGHKDR